MATEPRLGPRARPMSDGDRGAELALLMKAAESLLLAATQEREVFDVAVATLGERFGYGTRGFMLYDPQREELYSAAAAGVGMDRPEVMSFRVRLGQGLTGTCALYRRIVNVPDVRRDSRYINVIPETVSKICVPLVARDDLLGVLVVESPERAAFSEHDEALLTTFSQLVALALVNARANQARRGDLETISQRLSELQAIYEVAQRGASLDLAGTLDSAVDAIQRLTAADSSAIYLWQPDEEQLELAAITFDRRLYPADYEVRLRDLKPQLGQGLVGWVAQHREPLLLADVTKDGRMVQLPGVPLEARSGIVVPILAEDRLLGVIRAWKLGVESFTPDHYRFALTIASQSALALSAAEANRQQTARIRQLGALYETSLKLSESTTLEAVLQVVLRGAVQITGAEAGIIWRRQSDGTFALAAAHNLPAEEAAKRPPNDPGSMSNEMLRTGQPIVLADVQASQRSPWGFIAVARVQSLAGVPLRSEGVMYGSLFVGHSRPGFFRHEHVRHLEVLAAQAAATLARAGAFEEAHRLAITDELTSFYNARYLTGRVQEEVQRAGRYGHPLSLVMIDSDSLKMVNDRFGHEEGNRYLVELAQIIRENVRATDIVARFGGDEFLVLQPETELAAALATADRIRAAAARLFGPPEQTPIEVHVSGGVASFPATARDHEELFRQADHALYVAKRHGKNSVAAAPIPGREGQAN